MTHGHFDHVGGLKHLAREWDVPIYAHELEMPYLNGRADGEGPQTQTTGNPKVTELNE